MKKRIITVTLALVLAFNFLTVRPRAAGAGIAAAGLAVGVLAFNLIAVMSGEYDDVAEGIGCLIENGVEGWEKAFVGTATTPSWFASGWQQIFDTCSGWFDSGDITMTDDGKVSLTYSQYLELCDVLAGSLTDLDIDLGSSVDYKCFQWDFSQPVPVFGTPKYSGFYTDVGNSFLPIYYSSDKIYICKDFFCMQFVPSVSTGFFKFIGRTGWFLDNLDCSYANQILYNKLEAESSLAVNNVTFQFCFDTLNYCSNSNTQPKKLTAKLKEWFIWDGSTLSSASINDLDISGMTSGYISVSGYPGDFIKSLSKITVVSGVDVDDLSKVLPLDKTKNPTFVVDTDPAITIPDDAVLVTDVPGNPDMTLSEYKASTRLDIDIPSVISTKFPFCIPYDLIRILGVFCADPKAPVFRIPISTDKKYLEPFAGNQTIGEIPENFEPMFEIDEEIVIDLSVIPLVQPICYTVFIIGFVLLLIHITPKMINH